MHLLLIGISHKTAPVELRERLDFQTRGVDGALRALGARSSVHETVVLSTCNRAELYAAGDDVDSVRTELVAFLSEYHGIAREAVAPHLYEFVDLEAARHLFRVAAGLDSLVVGEPQILGQVKDAHGAATASQSAGPVLNRLFHSSFGVGKRVRTETGLGSGAVSVSFAAVALARKIFGDLKGRTVLVVGAGDMGKLTARHLKSQGVQQVTIVSRSMAHAARTAEAIGGASAAPWEELDTALGASDIVITATGAAAPILTKAHVEAVMRHAAAPSAVHHRHRDAPRRRGGRRRDRAGLSLQHRRSAGDRPREPGAPGQRDRRTPRRSSAKRSRSSRPGSDRVARFPPWSPCDSGSRRSAAPRSIGC